MSTDGFLHRYFLNNGSKRLDKWFHYFDIYERYFQKFRSRPVTMLEIGVFGGGSLEMWRDYFHDESTIVGIDIRPECAQLAEGNIKVHIGSQDDPDFLRQLSETYGGFDIVLDDGSHINKHMITSFEVLYPLLSPVGVYLVEDAHTSYWPKFGGGWRQEGTFIEFAKLLIDDLNASHARGHEPTDITRSTTGIHFYDSVVVFEKTPRGRPQKAVTKGL